ncbi:transposase [Paraliobacillus sediminis]|nr:transposase [Paraliobacillus sediminis]
MNAGYVSLIKELFPKAKIIIDRFIDNYSLPTLLDKVPQKNI